MMVNEPQRGVVNRITPPRCGSRSLSADSRAVGPGYITFAPLVLLPMAFVNYFRTFGPSLRTFGAFVSPLPADPQSLRTRSRAVLIASAASYLTTISTERLSPSLGEASWPYLWRR